MDKRLLNERDICTKFITPALRQAGWDEMTQIREEVRFTKGRITVQGKWIARGKGKRADYILYYRPNMPIAVVEAKDNKHAVGDGMQQALDYAETLDIPFAFSSNGDAFLFHDRTGGSQRLETELEMEAFPSPAALWQKYCAWKKLSTTDERLILQKYFDDGSGKVPRYYQVTAVNRALEAITKGQNRLLLVMATGTGKTYTAFQIIWRLWKSGRKKRILFLADRNILIDQTMVNDFRPFGAAMAKLSTRSRTIDRNRGKGPGAENPVGGKRSIDTAFEVYLSLYQAITGPDDRQKLYREFTRGFFDLIVVDECHRGSAAEDSAWREILEYFSDATQIGLTATPKETEYVSNIAYFGDPVYSYSLKQGISDGFLAPYKVVKVSINVDLDGYRPGKGTYDRYGQEVEDRTYGVDDFDRKIVIDDRTRLVAEKITDFLKQSGDRFQKTIVFCVDQEHASRMRQALINANRDLCSVNHRYVMRITGGDVAGNAQLSNFIDPESAYPVIVTTSRLLSTGVDVQTCRLIVIDRPIGSMTEFKQILGRGTRVHEDTNKFTFTVLDFRGATSHFADPGFDGEPAQVYVPGKDGCLVPPDDASTTDASTSDRDDNGSEDHKESPQPPDVSFPKGRVHRQRKLHINGIEVTISDEQVEYLDDRGLPATRNIYEFAGAALRERFSTIDEFYDEWRSADNKQAVLDKLNSQGLPMDALIEAVGENLDPFDFVCHAAFGMPAMTRNDRAGRLRERQVLDRHQSLARLVLEALVEKYEAEGVLDLKNPRILQIAPFSSMGTPVQIVRAFGTRTDFVRAVDEIQLALYPEAS
ncbi:EcoAI/FtnUII family type I restriction enzme subunit R [Micromonospora sp. NPDC023644]|uniref:EcoAI/FtnUII family type I restriction enzme subunit R n=1 Tax=Micromonospora sp. NPDC023644 TaxID=3154321 RepID=UPI0033CC3D86